MLEPHQSQFGYRFPTVDKETGGCVELEELYRLIAVLNAYVFHHRPFGREASFPQSLDRHERRASVYVVSKCVPFRILNWTEQPHCKSSPIEHNAASMMLCGGGIQLFYFGGQIKDLLAATQLVE